MKVCKIILLFICVFSLAGIQAQQDTAKKKEYFEENFLKYENCIYKNNIRTVLLHRPGFELSEPVILLGSDQKLLLSFDELNGTIEHYKYMFIHCTSDWKPTQINPHKVMDGYDDADIRDFRTSNTTLQPYMHYELSFPNDDIQFRISGNYIVLVFADDDPLKRALTARFCIVEPKVKIMAEVKRGNSLDDLERQQRIEFYLSASGAGLSDPYRNVDVIIRQNKRWDNAITNLKPSLVNGDVLEYHHDYGSVFNGGNEFRFFDNKSVKYNSENVDHIDAGDHLYEYYLKQDQKRNTKVYITETDINGRCLITTVDGRDPSVDGDYTLVHFSLKYAPPFFDGSVYLCGALTQWAFSKENKMIYNYSAKAYELTLLLKQGYYNYEYLFVENGKKDGDESRIEGSHFEAENEYDIFVYYSDPMLEYQRLMGWAVIQSRRK
ncbi:MAG: DUF5103 domain-containing protein [Bacteroidota bacterium]